MIPKAGPAPRRSKSAQAVPWRRIRSSGEGHGTGDSKGNGLLFLQTAPGCQKNVKRGAGCRPASIARHD